MNNNFLSQLNDILLEDEDDYQETQVQPRRRRKAPRTYIFNDGYVRTLNDGRYNLKCCSRVLDDTIQEFDIPICPDAMTFYWYFMGNIGLIGKECCRIDGRRGRKYYNQRKESCNLIGVYKRG
jgi:hypothetical protein